ncbi:MAG: ribonuclease Z [Clostridia bacterium]|nr:ribonuclease Z [Clostridia bacterium]
MKIKFYGTSHGGPEMGRECQCIFVDTEKGGYFFDMGVLASPKLKNDGYDVSRVKGIFITHLDRDHIAGLLDFILISTIRHKDMNFTVNLPEKRGFDAIKSYIEIMNEPFEEERIRYSVFTEGEIFDDGNLKVTAVKTEHLDEPKKSYGFLVEAEGKRIYITGDIHHTLEDFPNIAKEALDALITEGAHFEVDALFEKLEECLADKIMIIHTNRQAEKYPAFEKGKSRIKGELILPIDGDEFII